MQFVVDSWKEFLRLLPSRLEPGHTQFSGPYQITDIGLPLSNTDVMISCETDTSEIMPH